VLLASKLPKKREQNSRQNQHNGLRFFADYAAKKWPLSGQQESGHLAIPCGVTGRAFRSAALRLIKVEADINGILPAGRRAPAIYFVSLLIRLRSALGT
jgi:hypothetical protein